MRSRRLRTTSHVVPLACAAVTATLGWDAARASGWELGPAQRDNGRLMRTKFQPVVLKWHTKPVGCSMTAYFSSIGAGIDGVTLGRIKDLLDRDAAVVTVQPY